MIFLVVLCEGRTEMDFVQQVLLPHLAGYGITGRPIELGKKCKHDIPTAPGGVIKYEPLRRHISSALRDYSSDMSYVTTMVDFYAFPQDFPGYDELSHEPIPVKRVVIFEEELFKLVGRNKRFIPYIQLHEFEALIFADLMLLRSEFSKNQSALVGLDRLMDSVRGMAPEEINQTREGAPSKRLKAHIPYDKRAMGPRIAKSIGLERLRHSCPHFGEWLNRLENLPKAA